MLITWDTIGAAGTLFGTALLLGHSYYWDTYSWDILTLGTLFLLEQPYAWDTLSNETLEYWAILRSHETPSVVK